MIPAFHKIERLVWRAFFVRLFFHGAAALARTVALVAAAGLALFAVDWLFPLPDPWRKALWTGGALAGAAAFLNALRPWRHWTLQQAAWEAGRDLRPQDELLNAWDLSREPPSPDLMSPELVKRSLRQAAAHFETLSVGRAMRPAAWRRWIALGAAAATAVLLLFMALPPSGRAALLRVYYPFGPPFLAGLAVSPGHGVFPAGEDVPIEVRVADRVRREPELWVQTAAFHWERRPLESAPGPQGRVYRHTVRGLLVPLSYKVRHQGRWTPVFVLRPFHPPQFQRLRADIRFPAYTRRPPEVVENSLHLRALKGSRIRLTGRLDQPVARVTAVFENGRSVPADVEGRRDVSLTWDAYESGRLALRFEGPDLPLSDRNAVEFALDVVEDEAPRVQILSPAQDLLASPKDSLPIAYEVSDDFGVSEVALTYHRDGKTFTRDLGEPRGPGPDAEPREGVFDHVWRLEDLKLKPGDTIRYFLAARDNNVLSGPGEGVSATFSLSVASYEAEHEALEKSLEDFRKELLRILGEQTLVREDVGKKPSSSKEWASLAQRQSALKRGLSGQANRLQDLVNKMERDPLMDQVAGAEYEAILRNLRTLEQDAMARAEAGLAARSAEDAGRAMDEVVAELERLSLLAEDVLQSKALRDLLMNQEDLTQTAESLVEELAGRAGETLTAEERRRLQDVMDEAGRLMQEIVRQLQKMPQELPEDFVNQEAIKRLRLDEVQASMQALQQALQSGNAQDALAQAKKMLEQLKNIQKTLQQSAQNLPGGPSWYGSALGQQISELQKRLDDIVKRQESLKSAAQAILEKALARLMDQEKGLLRKLSGTADGLAATLESLQRDTFQAQDGELVLEARARAPHLRARLDNVRQEIQSQQIQESAKALEESLAQADALAKALADARARLLRSEDPAGQGDPPADAQGRAAELERLEKEWREFRDALENLKKRLEAPIEEKDFLAKNEAETAGAQAGQQETLEKDTRQLRQDLQVLARQTATLSTELARRLLLAAEAMGQAKEHLAAARMRRAVEQQETALRHLREGQSSLQSAAQSMMGLGQAGGRPMTGSIQPLPGSASGTGGAGAQLGPVRIPRAEDYRPPRQFREEVLKSMKEKYPRAYEEAIKDYYEKWAK